MGTIITPMGITWPSLGTDPYISEIGITQSGLDNIREDADCILGGGGIKSLVTNLFSWASPFYLYSSRQGTFVTIAAGSITISDGHSLYFTPTARPMPTETRTLVSAATVPAGAIWIGTRSGGEVWLRNMGGEGVGSLDDAYDVGSIVSVDDTDVEWNITGARSFIVDVTGAVGDDVDGFIVQNVVAPNGASDYFKLLKNTTNNELTLDATLGEISIYSWKDIDLIANGVTSEMTFQARSGNAITLNESGDVSLSGFTATSIIGALNELKAGSGVPSHLILGDLNAGTDGDAGHDGMVMKDGRSGGQVIIGGTATAQVLELRTNSVDSKKARLDGSAQVVSLKFEDPNVTATWLDAVQAFYTPGNGLGSGTYLQFGNSTKRSILMSSIDPIVNTAAVGTASRILHEKIATDWAIEQRGKITHGDGDTEAALTLENSGDNPATVKEFVGGRDPSGTISGSPGDVYKRSDGVESARYLNDGASSNVDAWRRMKVDPANPNGVSWQAVVAPGDNSWHSVAYGDGVFIAVTYTDNVVMRSVDGGVSWIEIPITDTYAWRSVTYGNGVFVAVASSGVNRTMRSTDKGLTWNGVAAAEDNLWYAVTYGNGVFVAVSSDGTNRTMRSTNDGVSWTAVAAGEDNSWRGVAFGNGVFVATSLGGTNRTMRSTNDGVSWTAVVAAESNSWRGVAFGNGVFISVSIGGTNRVMRSSDGGLTWDAMLATEGNSWYSAAYGDGAWVAVAIDGTNRIMRSGPEVTHGFYATKDTLPQTLVTATPLAVTYNVIRNNYGGHFATSAFTAPAAGWYSFSVNNQITTAAGGLVELHIKSDIQGVIASSSDSYSSAGTPTPQCSARVWLEAGEVITVEANQTTGSNATISNVNCKFDGLQEV